MEEITEETAELVARVAALDIGNAELTACVRVPHEDRPGRRRQEVRTFATTTRSLLDLRDWLICQGVEIRRAVKERHLALQSGGGPPAPTRSHAIGSSIAAGTHGAHRS